MDKDWKIETLKRIDIIISKLKNTDIKRLQLEYLKVVVTRIEKESLNCEKCMYSKADITDALDIIEKADIVTSIQIRAYNTRVKKIMSHLRKTHGLISSSYYAHQYSMYGFIGAIAMALPFFDQLLVMVSILLLGPFIGKIVGGFKDYRNQDSDKLI